MDPYRILGVSESATDDEITAAYRRLARKYHPDLHGGAPEAEERMKQLNAAYDEIRARRAGRSESQQAQGNPYAGNGTPYGGYGSAGHSGDAQEEDGTFYTYGPFGPFRVYRTGAPRRRPFSILRFLLTLMLLSALIRSCTAFTAYYAQMMNDYYEYHQTEGAPPAEEGGHRG